MIVKRMFWPFVDRAKPARAPSALHQEQITLVKREDVERFGAQRPKK